MISKIWNLVQPGARRSFLWLTVVVILGGLVELAGIGTVAEMMKLVATGGKSGAGGLLSHSFPILGVEDPSARLKVGLLLTLFVLALVHSYSSLRSYLRSQFVWLQDKEISTHLFSATLGRPYSWFLQRNSAELQYLLLSGQSIQRLLGNVLTALSYSAVALTLSAALIWINPWIALLGGVLIAIAYGAVRAATRQLLWVKGAHAHQAQSQRRKIAQEALTSIRFVKATGRERFFVEEFTDLSQTASKEMVFHDIYVDVVRSFLEWVCFAGLLSLSVYLIIQTDNFEELLPHLTLYTMAGYRIVPAIHELFGLWSRLRFDREYLDDLTELMNSPTLDESVTSKPIEGLTQESPLITLEKASFRHQGADHDTLCEIDLTVYRREWIGIVGTTGAGKTTLLDLLSGLCAPTAGSVTVGSTPLTAEYSADWQQRIGVVPQEVILLDDTLQRNVAFALLDEDIDFERVTKVCQAAGLGELIASLPEGYQTRLGERGVRLSGGERQRVGLARALYLKPDLLLLDEATSALDQATEARIVSTLRDLVDKCTLVTVAHRLSSVRPCDRIVVMDHGRIIDQGSYDELMESSETFRELALITPLDRPSRLSPLPTQDSAPR